MSQRRNLKTPTMLLLEARDPQQRSVSQIMLDAYRETGSEANAAMLMGITQQAYNTWKYRLNIARQIDQIAFNLKYTSSAIDQKTAGVISNEDEP